MDTLFLSFVRYLMSNSQSFAVVGDAALAYLYEIGEPTEEIEIITMGDNIQEFVEEFCNYMSIYRYDSYTYSNNEERITLRDNCGHYFKIICHHKILYNTFIPYTYINNIRTLDISTLCIQLCTDIGMILTAVDLHRLSALYYSYSGILDDYVHTAVTLTLNKFNKDKIQECISNYKGNIPKQELYTFIVDLFDTLNIDLNL